MLDPLTEAFPKASVLGMDVEPRSSSVFRNDWLTVRPPTSGSPPDLIFTNPPFRLAEHFLRKSQELVAENGCIVFLLRAAFLETKRRWNLLEEFPPAEVWFLRKRPKFTGPDALGGTDSAMYGWFVWYRGERPDFFEGHVL